MNNLPKNARKRDNLVISLQDQIKGLQEKKQNLLTENQKISKKMRILEKQQDLYNTQNKEISLLIQSLTENLAKSKELEFSQKDSNLQEGEIEKILVANGKNLQDYTKGYYAPAVCKMLGIPPVL